MKCIFRVDASNRMGVGHLARCVTLANALRGRGIDVSFICREHLGHLSDLLRRHALPVTLLPAPPPSAVSIDIEDYAVWLGVPVGEDAAQTIEALGGERPDWLVVDHYSLGFKWEREIRRHVRRLAVIDDFPTRRHECDLLLNQNYSTESPELYRQRLPDSTRALLGPHYALLARQYAEYRQVQPVRGPQCERVLVFFGGADPHNMTERALAALSQPECQSLEVDLVVGINHPYREALAAAAARRPLTRLHGSRPHLADLIARADVAIGAGGAMTWERMCLGLPSLVVSCADNQQPACDALHQAGLIRYLGHWSTIQSSEIAAAVLVLAKDSSARTDLALRGQAEVDGLGASRVAEVMAPTVATELRLVPDHHTTPSRSFSLYAQQLAVGSIRFEEDADADNRVDHSLDPCVDGRGWESQLLMLANKSLQNSQPVQLDVKSGARSHVPRGRFFRFDASAASWVGTAEPVTYSIAILSDSRSWLNPELATLAWAWLEQGHRVLWTHRAADLRPGDFCFYLGCGELVAASTLSMFRHNLVVHESDLPRGKGWSPLTWQVLEGRSRIAITLFEAAEKVDSGPIYAQDSIELSGDELIGELRASQARATLALCQRFVAEYPRILDAAREQAGEETYYRRRRAADSRVDPSRPLDDLFAQLRVADPDSYPAFFYRNGIRYNVLLRKGEAIE